MLRGFNKKLRFKKEERKVVKFSFACQRAQREEDVDGPSFQFLFKCLHVIARNFAHADQLS
jgi:hypothetical protein